MTRYIAICCWIVCCASAGAQGFGESPLPILVIDARAADIPDEPKVLTGMRLVYDGEGVRNRLDGPTRDYVGAVAIELRGSTSQTLFPKKGFKLELRGSDGADTSAALLGMPAEEDWVLHGPYSDKTLLRNAFTYTVARGLPGYAPRTRLVELVLGGEYWGLYHLTESVKRDGDRVDVAKLRAGDTAGDQLTGGYILKVDKATGDNAGGLIGFTLPPRRLRGQAATTLLLHYPKPRDIRPEQLDYIRAWMTDFEARLAGDDFEDPIRGYAPLIDEESFADFLFVNEIVRNVDAYRISTYLHKDRDSTDGRLRMGPVWDFNLALANADYGQADRAEGWAFDFDRIRPEDAFQAPFWYTRLWSSAGFRQNVARRWRTLRAEGAALSDDRLYGIFDSLAQVCGGEVATRNFARWPVLGEYTWPNAFVPDSHEAALAHARDYLTARLAWMDEQFRQELLPVDESPAGSGANVAPNPGFGAELRVMGLRRNDFPVEVEWYDGAGRRMGSSTVERRGDAFDAPAGADVLFYRGMGRGGWEGAGLWLR